VVKTKLTTIIGIMQKQYEKDHKEFVKQNEEKTKK
jgi:hypothetical protein